LPASFAPDQADNLVAGELERDAVHGAQAIESFGERRDAENSWLRGLSFCTVAAE
jgi:hypothetical protein